MVAGENPGARITLRFLSLPEEKSGLMFGIYISKPSKQTNNKKAKKKKKKKKMLGKLGGQ